MSRYAHMTRDEYVMDYLDRKDIRGFPTNAQVQKARDEWEEIQNGYAVTQSNDAYTDYRVLQHEYRMAGY